MGIAIRVEFDQLGGSVYPDKCSHAFGYDSGGKLITETITDGVGTWVKTFTYNADGRLENESLWVKQ